MLFLFDKNTTKKSVQKHEFDVCFSQILRGFLNSQIVAATSAGTFLRPSVAERYPARASRSMFVKIEGLPLTSENGIYQTSLRGISTNPKQLQSASE